MKRQKKRLTLGPWLLLVAAFAIALVGWVAIQAVRQRSLGNPLGPTGVPSTAQDLDSLVGQKAPVFSLRDPQGDMHTVVPGKGRPIVLIFHMGLH